MTVRALEGGDEWDSGSGADRLLERAMDANPFVAGGLLTPEFSPAVPPDSYAEGDEDEADVIVDLQWRAWHRRPDALDWLHHRLEGGARPPDEPVWERILQSDTEGLREGLSAFLDPCDEAVTSRLIAFVEEATLDGDEHIADNAILLLGLLGLAARAVPEVVTFIQRHLISGDIHSTHVDLFCAAAGSDAVEPLLAAHDSEPLVEDRLALLEALVWTRVRTPAIYDRLLAYFGERPMEGAALLASYGDDRALPHLSKSLDASDPEPRSGTPVADLIDAIHDLGGGLTPSQEERFAFFVEARNRQQTPSGRRDLARQVMEAVRKIREEDEASFEEDALFEEDRWPPEFGAAPPSAYPYSLPLQDDGATIQARGDRPGRNEPCWCGSGKKYKRCHLAADETGR